MPHQPLQFFPFVPAPRFSPAPDASAFHAEDKSRELAPSHLHHQAHAVGVVATAGPECAGLLPTAAFDALGVRPAPELHAKRIEPAFGDFYVVCSCGFVSTEFVAKPTRLECAVEDAEVERARNRQLFRARLLRGR